jgi:hypothetical protein
MTTILKLIVVAFATFCASMVLLIGWNSYIIYRARKAGIIKPGQVIATDILGLLSLFHSPWFCLELAGDRSGGPATRSALGVLSKRAQLSGLWLKDVRGSLKGFERNRDFSTVNR